MKVLDRVEKAIENAKKLTTKDRKKLKGNPLIKIFKFLKFLPDWPAG